MTIADRFHVSILSAPVAAADRRALSQAWYSALYRSSANVPERPQISPTAALQAPRSRAAQPTTQKPHAGKLAAALPRSAEPPRRSDAFVSPERRAARSSLARKIEAAFLRPGAAPRTATFSLGEEGRVRISLRMDGSAVRLIAVCAPSVRAKVAQALAQARYAMALRGITLSSDLEERAQ